MEEAPLSATETTIVMDFFVTVQTSRVLTIHQPLNGIDYDGPAKELAQRLSDISDVRIHRLGSQSKGSLGSFVGKDLETPDITLEIPGYANDQSADWLWARYGALLHAFIVYEPTNQSIQIKGNFQLKWDILSTKESTHFYDYVRRFVMGSTVPAPEYTGMDKYPGWIATIITVVITAIFIGALVVSADHGDHGDLAEGADHHCQWKEQAH